MTTRRKLTFGLVAVAGVLALSCCVIQPAIQWLINPLRRSNETIAASLFKESPVGSSRTVVQETIKSHGWPSGGMPDEPIGSVTVSLGSYTEYYIADMAVFAVYVFDDHDRLENIRVWRFWGNAP